MSETFEASAQPTALVTGDSDLAQRQDNSSDSVNSTPAESTSTSQTGAAETEPAPAPARRTTRRSTSRSRKTAPPPEAPTETSIAETAAETPVLEEELPPPPPRRRRTRKQAETIPEPAAASESTGLPPADASVLASTPDSIERSPEGPETLPISVVESSGAESPIAAAIVDAGPVETEAVASSDFPAVPVLLDEAADTGLSTDLATTHPTTVPTTPDDSEILLQAGLAETEAPVPGEEGEAADDGSGPRRRRSRRGSRGGRRGRGRRGAVEGEADVSELPAEAVEAAPSSDAGLPETVADTGVPVIETPLPDVSVYFRPVARPRVVPPDAPTGMEIPEPPSAAAGPAEAPEEGEPTSRGRRRRRRGERGERPAAATEREEKSGVGGALPPRAERAEPVAEVAVPPAPEVSTEKPRVERVGRGQRGDRVLERAAARADREVVRAEKDAEKVERVTKEIVINVSPRETRIAVLENGRLVELHVEREERVVGSVFKGRVANVLPGMDAAFVDIGLDRNAFLYVGDILFEGGEEGAPTARRPRDLKIRDVAKPGQELLVQVVKGPRGTKGARVSTRMSLPGRYIVLMPEGENLGVSRKIEDPAERDRLKRIGERLRPAGFGVIIRTEAEERTEEELKQDLDLLLNLWQQIQTKSRHAKAAALIHQDLSLILKTIRDVFGADVDRLLLDSEEDYQKVREMLEILSPELMDRVSFYSEPEPIFSRYGLEDEIERLLRRKVWLKSGGYITIDVSEALTAIDVNTGKFVGTTSLSDTILKTNLDAVQEIARQLRLRDIGGMIVLDFIDMNSARDRAQVMAALDRALRKDRTRTKVAHISPLGLIEMTRKRTGEMVTELITQTCDYCQGRGRTLSPETMSIQIERAIRRRCAEGNFEAVLVHAHPEVCAHLIGAEGENVEAIERLLRRPIYVRARHDFHLEKFEILPGDMLEIEKGLLPYRGGHVVECDVQKLDLITAPRSAAWVDGYFVDLANGTRYQGSRIRVRLTDVRRSFALGEPVAPATALDKTEPI